jgi:hypothetical protein
MVSPSKRTDSPKGEAAGKKNNKNKDLADADSPKGERLAAQAAVSVPPRVHCAPGHTQTRSGNGSAMPCEDLAPRESLRKRR